MVPNVREPAVPLDIPKIVSADDHVVEPAGVWQDRLPQKYRDIGPRIVRASADMSFFGGKFSYTMGGDGPAADWWCYEDLRWPHTRLGACAGFAPEEIKVASITYDEMRPGCFETSARLADMDLNWVDASLCFPTFPRFCGQTFYEAKDKDLALLCVKAYNDWMVDEWCAGSGGRLIPLCLIPLWDPALAAAEVRRNAARGVRAVCFSEQPYHLGLPSIHDKDRYWEPFVAACAETGTVICMHSGSGSKMPSTSPDAPPAVGSTLTHELAEQSLADWLFSGLLVRYPDLVITYSEGQIGWIPYILERADRIWEHNRGWNEVRELIPEPPSTYYWGRVYGCFFEDPAGLAQLDAIGPDQVTFEVDYPHADGTWPHSKAIVEGMLGGLRPETIYKLVRGNTIKMLGLQLD